MILALKRLICRWTRHRWGKPYSESLEGIAVQRRLKRCRRCGLIAPVRARKAKLREAA